ncbi:sulfatase family protein [Anatilimnocola floriformis]|uniref:sulfatase family protein n=1 Tax=Anatilimnocola floriformis TaxID=2948575 RepID=UPI0020C269FD|nr:sulfatase [Anatilimnocola floriformis]
MLILADDLGQIECSPYAPKDGPTPATTPNMQRLAKAGMTFSQAFVPSASCAPNRASLLTGLNIARHGAVNNHDKPRPAIKKWPAYFQELGYELAAFGKVSHYKHTVDYGFDEFAFDTFHDHRGIGAAVEFLEKRNPAQAKPLCLLVGTNWPHVPWPDEINGYDPAKLRLPPTMVETPATRDAFARYLTAVTKADADLGVIYDAAEKHLGTNTLFVFTSDHGAQFPFGKWNCYDAGLRVPLIAKWSGVIKPDSQTKAIVSWLDLLPTMTDAAGGTPPVSGLAADQIDGQSFLPILNGKQEKHREQVFAAHNRDQQMNVYPIRSVRDEKWKYIQNLRPDFKHTTHIDKQPGKNDYFATWVEKAKSDATAAELVKRYHTRPAEELYDLAADPYEEHNLATLPEHSARVTKMREEVKSWMLQMGDKGLTGPPPK